MSRRHLRSCGQARPPDLDAELEHELEELDEDETSDAIRADDELLDLVGRMGHSSEPVPLFFGTPRQRELGSLLVAWSRERRASEVRPSPVAAVRVRPPARVPRSPFVAAVAAVAIMVGAAGVSTQQIPPAGGAPSARTASSVSVGLEADGLAGMPLIGGAGGDDATDSGRPPRGYLPRAAPVPDDSSRAAPDSSDQVRSSGTEIEAGARNVPTTSVNAADGDPPRLSSPSRVDEDADDGAGASALALDGSGSSDGGSTGDSTDGGGSVPGSDGHESSAGETSGRDGSASATDDQPVRPTSAEGPATRSNAAPPPRTVTSPRGIPLPPGALRRHHTPTTTTTGTTTTTTTTTTKALHTATR